MSLSKLFDARRESLEMMDERQWLRACEGADDEIRRLDTRSIEAVLQYIVVSSVADDKATLRDLFVEILAMRRE